MRKIFSKFLAIFLTVTLLQSSIAGFSVLAMTTDKLPKNFGVMSDLHLFPESLIDKNSADFQLQTHSNSKLMGESEAVLKATLETVAQRKAQGTYNMDYLLIAGDLTFNGEKPAHVKLAALLKEFERNTGIQVYVVNGNHDVNNYTAASYTAVPGKKITARDNPGLLLTTPEEFRSIYADFGYNQADSVYVPAAGKAGMLSYALSLPGGYRLIAVDSCIYSSDVTKGGKDESQSDVAIATKELLDWTLTECRNAAARGETVIGLTHGNIVEHFDFQGAIAKNFIIPDYERISYELADAGMHFVFTGHNHINDTASIVSGNNEILYDIETCGLTTYPNIYREAAFNNTMGNGCADCKLTNVDCDDQSAVDISGISDQYGVIEKRFCENYSMPMLYGGSIEKGIRSDAAVFLNSLISPRLPGIIKKALPKGIGGLLSDKGINIESEIANFSPALNDTLKAFNLSPTTFSLFVDSIIAQIDTKYILNTAHTVELVTAAVERLSKFELVEGNNKTELGKIIMLGMCGMTAGDESLQKYPEVISVINTLRTQAGADRVIKELLDIVINDVLFDDILPSISLNELDSLLPAQVMLKLRTIAGNDLTVGSLLDKILNTAAAGMKGNEFLKIKTGRDVAKDFVYVAGYKYLNPASRLKISCALSDVISSLMQDNNPEGLSDSNTTLHYTGKVSVSPTAENYRLPADVQIVPGAKSGEVKITWNTIYGIEGSDIELSPLPASVQISKGVETITKDFALLDVGFYTLNKTRSLLSHSITISGLETGIDYSYTIGDKGKGLVAQKESFKINNDGKIERNTATGTNNFFSKLLSILSKAVEFIKTLISFMYLFP